MGNGPAHFPQSGNGPKQNRNRTETEQKQNRNRTETEQKQNRNKTAGWAG